MRRARIEIRADDIRALSAVADRPSGGDIASAVADYIGTVGGQEDLTLLDHPIFGTDGAAMSAAVARLEVTLRVGESAGAAKEALDGVLNKQALEIDRRVAPLILKHGSIFDTSTLMQIIDRKDESVVVAGLRVLLDRGVLETTTLKALCENSHSKVIRAWAYRMRIELGGRVNCDNMRKRLSPSTTGYFLEDDSDGPIDDGYAHP